MKCCLGGAPLAAQAQQTGEEEVKVLRLADVAVPPGFFPWVRSWFWSPCQTSTCWIICRRSWMGSFKFWATMAKRFGKCEWREGQTATSSGTLRCAHVAHTSRRVAAAEQEVPSFLPGLCASHREELRAHQPPAPEKHPGIPDKFKE